jgi:hypothetical protein
MPIGNFNIINDFDPLIVKYSWFINWLKPKIKPIKRSEFNNFLKIQYIIPEIITGHNTRKELLIHQTNNKKIECREDFKRLMMSYFHLSVAIYEHNGKEIFLLHYCHDIEREVAREFSLQDRNDIKISIKDEKDELDLKVDNIIRIKLGDIIEDMTINKFKKLIKYNEINKEELFSIIHYIKKDEINKCIKNKHESRNILNTLFPKEYFKYYDEDMNDIIYYDDYLSGLIIITKIKEHLKITDQMIVYLINNILDLIYNIINDITGSFNCSDDALKDFSDNYNFFIEEIKKY